MKKLNHTPNFRKVLFKNRRALKSNAISLLGSFMSYCYVYCASMKWTQENSRQSVLFFELKTSAQSRKRRKEKSISSVLTWLWNWQRKSPYYPCFLSWVCIFVGKKYIQVSQKHFLVLPLSSQKRMGNNGAFYFLPFLFFCALHCFYHFLFLESASRMFNCSTHCQIIQLKTEIFFYWVSSKKISFFSFHLPF